MSKKEDIIQELNEKYKSSFKKGGEISFRTDNYILTGIIEKELAKSRRLNDAEKAGILEQILRERCNYRGFQNNELEDYIRAILNEKQDERKRILLGIAGRFEKAESFVWAAEEYFESGETQKAAEILVRAGHQGFNDGEEFLMAADCLVKAGFEKEKAYSRMSEEIMKMMKSKKEKYKRWSTIDRAYFYLGECLHNAGKRKEALKAFMKTESEKYLQLEAGRNYLERIEDWKGAAEAQEELVTEHNFSDCSDYLNLAEYYNKAGFKKEEANALWKARNYLEAARIAFSITKNNEVFLKAGNAYRNIRPERKRDFFREVWEFFHKGCWDTSLDKSIEKNMQEKLNRVHDSFIFLYSAYSLPVPKKISDNLEDNIEKHRETANKLYKEFLEKKNSAKKSQLEGILSDSTLVNAAEHAVLGGLKVYEIEDIFKKAFMEMPRKRPIEANLTPEAKKLWQKSVDWEIRFVGYDPFERAARTYEEGGYYKEAKERYSKANLFEDAKRMDKLIENYNTKKSNKK